MAHGCEAWQSKKLKAPQSAAAAEVARGGGGAASAPGLASAAVEAAAAAAAPKAGARSPRREEVAKPCRSADRAVSPDSNARASARPLLRN